MNKVIPILLSIMIVPGCSLPKTNNEQPEKYSYNTEAEGPRLELNFIKGASHNHPLMAVWIEDTEGNFLETLYVAESIGKGVFDHGDATRGKWLPGEIRRPAALPVWGHSRGIPAADGLYVPAASDPLPDAITGPTPPGNFIMRLNAGTDVPKIFHVLMEINQSWDWNEYWTNNLYPEDEDYKTSCQPALVYRGIVNLDKPDQKVPLKLAGHSHFSGDNGEIYEDLSTITTALNIVDSLWVKVLE